MKWEGYWGACWYGQEMRLLLEEYTDSFAYTEAIPALVAMYLMKLLFIQFCLHLDFINYHIIRINSYRKEKSLKSIYSYWYLSQYIILKILILMLFNNSLAYNENIDSLKGIYSSYYWQIKDFFLFYYHVFKWMACN